MTLKTWRLPCFFYDFYRSIICTSMWLLLVANEVVHKGGSASRGGLHQEGSGSRGGLHPGGWSVYRWLCIHRGLPSGVGVGWADTLPDSEKVSYYNIKFTSSIIFIWMRWSLFWNSSFFSISSLDQKYFTFSFLFFGFIQFCNTNKKINIRKVDLDGLF